MKIIQQEMNLARRFKPIYCPELCLMPGYDIAGTAPGQTGRRRFYDFISLPANAWSSVWRCIGQGYSGCHVDGQSTGYPAPSDTRSACARECLEHSNTLLYNSTDSEKFATLFYALLDLATTACVLPMPAIPPFPDFAAGEIQRLKSIGIPLDFWSI